VVSVPKIWEVYLLMTSARRSLCCVVGLVWFVWFMDLISFLLLSREVSCLFCVWASGQVQFGVSCTGDKSEGSKHCFVRRILFASCISTIICLRDDLMYCI
jgi:hypothetical protein